MMDDCDSIVFYGCSINDLPDEVLEYILSLLPPYKDLESCMLVCKRWKKNVSNVIQHTKHKMLRSLANFDLKWEIVVPSEKFQTITKRYSHSACYHENSMYVFGGCTCTSTTFNDLWKLDLSTRQWSRLLTMGTYPSPKACATILYYDGSLILFGGWTHPSPYPLHQAWKTFNEFHMYDIAANRWCSITTVTNTPPPMAGHSATIHKDNMVVFGGLQGQSGSSNDIWCFNFYTQTWTKQNVTGTKPQSRYGQSQIAVDDTHLLILGGCGGGNMNLNDIWLLNMTDPIWTWRRVAIRNPQWAASHLWCHPACKVGHYVVVFSRNPVALCPFSYSKWRPTAQMQPDVDRDIPRHRTTPFSSRRDSDSSVEPPAFDRDVNVNGRRGSLNARSARSELSEDKSSASSSLSSLIPIGDTSQVHNKTSSSSLSPYEDISSVSEMNSATEDSNLILNPSSSNQSGSDLSVAVNINNNSSSSSSSNSSSYRSGNIKNISKEKNNSNFSRNIPGAELSQTRRLEFVSPPNCNTGMAAFRDTYSTSTVNNGRQRERQLEALRRIEERLRNKNKEKTPPPPPLPSPPLPLPQSSSPSTLPSVSKKETQSQACQTTPPKFLIAPKLAMFVLDISTVLTDECFVTWLPIKSVAEDSPDDMILYSLIHGNGELIMFGGIQKDAMSINQQAQSSLNISNIVSNSLHFMTPPRSII